MKKIIRLIISSAMVTCLLCSCTKNDVGAENAATEETPREVTLILDPDSDAVGTEETTEQVQPEASQTDDEDGTAEETDGNSSDSSEGNADEETVSEDGEDDASTVSESAAEADSGESEATVIDGLTVSTVSVTDSMTYASFSAIRTGSATLYKNPDPVRGKFVVCVNAGHGTSGGQSVKTQCHPDGSPKVTGGTTGAGATTAVAVSSGMTFGDGKSEASVTLAQALILKEMLLSKGYSVLMIRETDDVQLDNVARTVLANQYADCHIAIHWDSSESDKGAFYCSVPDVASYRAMEPVASTWQKSHALGDSIIAGLKGQGIKILSSGSMAIDLTQTSYSSIPSIDLELGDKASDHSESRLRLNAAGIIAGLDAFFGL